MTDHYLTLAAPAEGQYTEKRSRFLAFALHVGSEDDAKAQVKAFQKKYYDARHVCYAYALGPTAERIRANDAGEPSGTAGKPILGQIRSFGLTDTLVIVVRYYGGTPLGAANLGRAYQAAAEAALAAAETCECVLTSEIRVSVPYPDEDAVMRIVREAGAEVRQRNYEATQQQMTISVRQSAAQQLEQRLHQIFTLRWPDENQ